MLKFDCKGESMSRKVKIGKLYIGGGEKIAIQSMSTFKASNIIDCIKEAKVLEQNGCDIIRYSVLDEKDANSFSEIKKHTSMPIVADIHFDYRLALQSIKGGADKIRINPGNIGSQKNIEKVAKAIKENGVAVRVGANTGSIEKEFLSKYGKNEISLGESALKNVQVLEKYGVENIVVSVKASSVPLMIKAYEYIAKKVDYPLHLGVTEAGGEYNGIIKNSIGIGSLLSRGIGDTIRVSLSAEPIREVFCAKQILKSLNLIDDGVDVVACPTCGRCEWDCMKMASKVEDYVKNKQKPLKIAVMGCVVNGPGEAVDADIGIAGGKDKCVIFKDGNIIKTVKKEDAELEFFKEIDKCLL